MPLQVMLTWLTPCLLIQRIGKNCGVGARLFMTRSRQTFPGVMVDGQRLMRDGQVLTVDEAYRVRRAEQVWHAVWERLLSRYSGESHLP